LWELNESMERVDSEVMYADTGCLLVKIYSVKKKIRVGVPQGGFKLRKREELYETSRGLCRRIRGNQDASGTFSYKH
jgi:hypothetical protein